MRVSDEIEQFALLVCAEFRRNSSHWDYLIKCVIRKAILNFLCSLSYKLKSTYVYKLFHITQTDNQKRAKSIAYCTLLKPS